MISVTVMSVNFIGDGIRTPSTPAAQPLERHDRRSRWRERPAGDGLVSWIGVVGHR